MGNYTKIQKKIEKAHKFLKEAELLNEQNRVAVIRRNEWDNTNITQYQKGYTSGMTDATEGATMKNKLLYNWKKRELVDALKRRNFQYGELSNKYASLKYSFEELQSNIIVKVLSKWKGKEEFVDWMNNSQEKPKSTGARGESGVTVLKPIPGVNSAEDEPKTKEVAEMMMMPKIDSKFCADMLKGLSEFRLRDGTLPFATPDYMYLEECIDYLEGKENAQDPISAQQNKTIKELSELRKDPNYIKREKEFDKMAEKFDDTDAEQDELCKNCNKIFDYHALGGYCYINGRKTTKEFTPQNKSVTEKKDGI